MTASARLNADDVRAELSVEAVLHAYGLQPRRTGSEYRLRECPRCRARTKRAAVAINARTGQWCHHGHERAAGGHCSGDVFDLVAAFEGLDTRRDFARVLERCAEIACIAVDPVDRDAEARRVRRAREAAERHKLAEIEERDRRERAFVVAGAHWRDLARRHPTGVAFLHSRGLDAEALIARGAVRFEPSGDIAVALHTADGRIISVARRLLSPREGFPKVLTLPGCPATGTLVGALPDIVHGRDVVLVEGITDALAACLAWPTAVVLGANGAGRLPRIAAAAAPRVKLAGARLLLVPDDDEVGQRSMIEAGRAAIAAGLVYRRTLRVVEDYGADTDAKDLADAWRAGWRPAGDDR